MAAVVSLVPEVVDLALYAGDGVRLRLPLSDPQGGPIEVTGQVAAQIRATRTGEVAAEFAAETGTSEITLWLTGAQTAALLAGDAAKFSGTWDVQWTAEGGEPRTLVQGKVTCVLDVTRAG